MKNKDLKPLYNQVYQQGKEKFFSKYKDGRIISETDQVILASTNWLEKVVRYRETNHISGLEGATALYVIKQAE